jgi:hypothetical protein
LLLLSIKNIQWFRAGSPGSGTRPTGTSGVINGKGISNGYRERKEGSGVGSPIVGYEDGVRVRLNG